MRSIIYLLFILLYSPLAGFAQWVSPTNPYLYYSGNDYFIVQSTITNNTQDETLFFWKRTIKQLPVGWETSICDPQYCKVVDVDTATFFLAIGAKGKLDCNFYLGSNAQSGTAIIELELYPKKAPEKKVIITYTGQGDLSVAGNYRHNIDFNQKFNIHIVENTIEVDAVQPTSNPINVECVDVLGNIVFRSENLVNLPVKLATNAMSHGLYFVKIWSDSENYWSKKIVID